MTTTDCISDRGAAALKSQRLTAHVGFTQLAKFDNRSGLYRPVKKQRECILICGLQGNLMPRWIYFCCLCLYQLWSPRFASSKPHFNSKLHMKPHDTRLYEICR